MNREKIYIAGSFATSQERASLEEMIAAVKDEFKDRYFDLYIPMEFKVEGDFQNEDGTWNLPNHVWAKKVYENDLKELDSSNIVIAMYSGHRGSTGTPWEIGYACGKGITVLVYIPEWAETNDMSLMIINSVRGRFYLKPREDNGMCGRRVEWRHADFGSQFNQK